jgi:hypothetical protein
MPAPEKPGAVIELTFEGCVQDSREYGSDWEHMVSRVFYWVRREGGPNGDFRRDLELVSGAYFAKLRIDPPAGYTGPMLYAELRQPVGDDFQMGRIEVAPSPGRRESFREADFAQEALTYFRGLMSDAGAMVRVDEGRPLRGSLRTTQHVRLRHNVEASRKTVRLAAG